MIKSLIIVTLCGFASAARSFSRASSASFSLISISSGSNVQYDLVTASNYGFWLNKPTNSSCPSTINACPNGDDTALSFNQGSLYMDVAVPGGQQVYVTPSGGFGYTAPASTQFPDSAITLGFQYSPPASLFTLGSLTLQNFGFLACPLGTGFVYQISVSNGTATPSGCIEITLATVSWSSANTAAYQYN